MSHTPEYTVNIYQDLKDHYSKNKHLEELYNRACTMAGIQAEQTEELRITQSLSLQNSTMTAAEITGFGYKVMFNTAADAGSFMQIVQNLKSRLSSEDNTRKAEKLMRLEQKFSNKSTLSELAAKITGKTRMHARAQRRIEDLSAPSGYDSIKIEQQHAAPQAPAA